jgi:protein tyrosine/serine phosphatase
MPSQLKAHVSMKIFLKRTAIGLLVGGLSFGAHLGILQLTGNFHEVVAGELYRSNQPSASRIASYAKDYGIRTIVNLRGKNDGAAWYSEEIAKASELGLTHVDFRMSASQELSMSEIAETSLMRDLPKPILIHCQSGSDRTGLVSAIYLNQIAGMDAEDAERQLSIRYGHFGIPYLSAAYPMDESWEKLETTLTPTAGSQG